MKALAVGVFATVGMALWGVWFLLACALVGLILISASGLEG